MRIKFEIEGDVSIPFDPIDYDDCATLEDFKSELVEAAEEQASWSARLVGDSYDELWAEVVKAREEVR